MAYRKVRMAGDVSDYRIVKRDGAMVTWQAREITRDASSTEASKRDSLSVRIP
jgi:hypothetical protein